MFLFYSFMCFRTKCVNKCLHENEFFSGLVRAYFVVQMLVYMSMRICQCPYADSASARECLSHASTYLECSHATFTCGFYGRPSLKITTKHEDFKKRTKSTV